MTENTQMLLKGATALGAAALVIGLLIAYTNAANLGGEGGEDDDREEQVEAQGIGGTGLTQDLRDAAQVLHPGRIVEMEPRQGGRTYEIETLGTMASDGRWYSTARASCCATSVIDRAGPAARAGDNSRRVVRKSS